MFKLNSLVDIDLGFELLDLIEKLDAVPSVTKVGMKSQGLVKKPQN